MSDAYPKRPSLGISLRTIPKRQRPDSGEQDAVRVQPYVPFPKGMSQAPVPTVVTQAWTDPEYDEEDGEQPGGAGEQSSDARTAQQCMVCGLSCFPDCSPDGSPLVLCGCVVPESSRVVPGPHNITDPHEPGEQSSGAGRIQTVRTSRRLGDTEQNSTPKRAPTPPPHKPPPHVVGPTPPPKPPPPHVVGPKPPAKPPPPHVVGPKPPKCDPPPHMVGPKPLDTEDWNVADAAPPKVVAPPPKVVAPPPKVIPARRTPEMIPAKYPQLPWVTQPAMLMTKPQVVPPRSSPKAEAQPLVVPPRFEQTASSSSGSQVHRHVADDADQYHGEENSDQGWVQSEGYGDLVDLDADEGGWCWNESDGWHQSEGYGDHVDMDADAYDGCWNDSEGWHESEGYGDHVDLDADAF